MTNTNIGWRTRLRQTPESLNSSMADSKYGEYVAKPMTTNTSKRIIDVRKKINRPNTKGPNQSFRKKTMNYDEIKKIREEFNLERHEVYTLMSEFNSMLYMQDNQSSDDEDSDK